MINPEVEELLEGLYVCEVEQGRYPPAQIMESPTVTLFLYLPRQWPINIPRWAALPLLVKSCRIRKPTRCRDSGKKTLGTGKLATIHI